MEIIFLTFPATAARARWAIFSSLILLLACAFTREAQGMTVLALRCEQLENPLGIDAVRPRLSWKLGSNKRAQKQTACEILVASSEHALRLGQADLWDSGKVMSGDTVEIYYNGTPLTSRRQCFWKVRVWDQDGNVFESKIATWEMGLLQPSDWVAKWIGRTTNVDAPTAPLLRQNFVLDSKIRQARAYVCGLGYFELYLNGKRVGDHLLDPGYTRYDRRALYVTHDVTDLLKSGENAVGVVLGNGWFNVLNKTAWDWDKAPWRSAPKLVCQLEIEFNDGHRLVVASGSDWKTSESPIIYNTIYSGEVYDARREQAGWNLPGFHDSAWTPALLVDAPQGIISAQMMPPIRVDRTFTPASVTEPQPGVFVFDFGQNLSGNAQLSVRGPAGAEVSMRYAERLATNGLVDQADIAQHVVRFDKSQRFQTDTYILKGGARENWKSRFAYDGFRYVEVRGFPGRPDKDSLRAIFFHSDVPPTGHFECSNPLLNRIAAAAQRSYLGNLQGIPTDCPHREKNGWTGDAHLAAELGMFNFFPSAVYNKWIQDLADEQRPDGRLPGIVPSSGWGYAWGNGPAWDSAFLLIPYYQYLYYGDTDQFRRHYDSLKLYVDYLTSRAKEGIVNIGLNDWAPARTRTDAAITDTAYYFIDTKIVALAATLLGKEEDARHYQTQAASIKQAFAQRFYQPATGLYDNGSQTALSCALYQGLVEPENKDLVLSNLVAAVQKSNWHVDTGILGAKYLLNALTDNGRTDVAYRIAGQKDRPGWGWWIEQGATTLWEQWDGGASRFHVMYGDIDAWFYKALAGINPDPAAPGFKHFFVTPHVAGDLTSAGAEYDSARGEIISHWKIVNGEFRLDLTVPANTTATVSLPIIDPAQVKEGGKPVRQSVGPEFQKADDRRTVFLVPSGTYAFSGPLDLDQFAMKQPK
jgi:alpha-L-rhamnosidase